MCAAAAAAASIKARYMAICSNSSCSVLPPKKAFPKTWERRISISGGMAKKEDNGDWGRRLCFYMILINFNAATRSGCFGATAAALRAAIQMNLGYLKIKYVLSDG
jgi:hypothetical protein